MKIASSTLINELIELTTQHIALAQQLQHNSPEQLNKRPYEGSWSTLECIEHLNRYADFYLPEIEQRIKSSTAPSREIFQSGLLGNYFANTMLPKSKLNKMKTFKKMDPIGSQLTADVIRIFILQQQRLIQILNTARQADLQKIKTSISISRWIKIRLGDTFSVLIYHNERHMQQIKRIGIL